MDSDFTVNEHLQRWLFNLQIRDIILEVTNQVKSAKTAYAFHPAGIDPDGSIAYNLHVQRFLEPIYPIERVNLTFTVTKDGVNFE